MSSITVPASGSVISSAAIEAVYDTLRNKANALTSADFERQALGVQHFAKNTGGVIRERDFVENLVLTTVTGTMTDETMADIAANWTNLANYTLNNGGAGYSVTGPAWLIFYFNFRFEKWSGAPNPEVMAYFSASYAVDGGAEAKLPLSTVGVHSESWKTGVDHQEKSIAWWDAVDLTAKAGSWTLNYLKFYAARCQCGAGALPANFTIPHGTTGFFLVKA